MTIVVLGKVLSRDLKNIVVEDFDTKEKLSLKLDQEGLDELKLGETAIFVGKKNISGIIEVSRIEPRKFLDPLYEDEVIENSSFSLVELIDNPFEKEFQERAGL